MKENIIYSVAVALLCFSFSTVVQAQFQDKDMHLAEPIETNFCYDFGQGMTYMGGSFAVFGAGALGIGNLIFELTEAKKCWTSANLQKNSANFAVWILNLRRRRNERREIISPT